MENDNDISLCDQEPIHIPGQIQPNGYTVSYDIKNKLITSLSANIPNAKNLIGESVFEIVPKTIFNELLVRIDSNEHEDILYEIELPFLGESLYDIAQLDSNLEMILEIYPHKISRDQHECNFRLANSISNIVPSQSIEQMCSKAAKEVKRISKLDRVMIYRFDPDYNGSVIAEEREESLNSYMGLHFPADDIPKQARELYRKQTVRLISDVDYTPVDIVRQTGLEPLNMTYSQLRSVSPIHVEYLKNMNVKATLTISILVNDKLWGLIACHNYKALEFSLRHMELIRTFGIFFSGILEAKINGIIEKRSVELHSTLDTIVRSMQMSQKDVMLSNIIGQHKKMFFTLFEADGFAFLVKDLLIGTYDEIFEDEIKNIISYLKPHISNGVFSTHNLARYLPDLDGELLKRYSGILLVEVMGKHPTYWLWYRQEQTATLHWGGDPRNRMTINEDGRIQPRQSFEAFKEVVRFNSKRWEAVDVDFMSNFTKALKGFFDWLESIMQVDIQRVQIKFMEDEKAQHYKQLLESLVDMIEQRDAYTAGHTLRVGMFCEKIAKELGLERKRRKKIYEAAILHDIGKLVVPDSVLLKPGKLTKNEFELIKQHLSAGYEILNKIEYYKPLAEIIRYHHEKYDGSGYFGFKGKDISIDSHILIVADAIDAMTSNRIYQARKSMEEALEEIKSFAGKWYHPDVAQAAYDALKDIDLGKNSSQIPLTAMEKARFSYYFKDQLTSAYNETYLKMVLEGMIPEVYFEEFVMVCIGGMSKFNAKNGWHGGDKILSSIGMQIHTKISKEHIFRVMGDDFIIGCRNKEECTTIASQLKLDLPSEINVNINIVDKKRVINFIE